MDTGAESDLNSLCQATGENDMRRGVVGGGEPKRGELTDTDKDGNVLDGPPAPRSALLQTAQERNKLLR
jgi:hypothetical protein